MYTQIHTGSSTDLHVNTRPTHTPTPEHVAGARTTQHTHTHTHTDIHPYRPSNQRTTHQYTRAHGATNQHSHTHTHTSTPTHRHTHTHYIYTVCHAYSTSQP
eukprot:GHVQ01035914.1.p1 GENE.GHVQ01035914.1~~GHVQ01035914.1.p1  ORF type:complete len:102 (-),score=26.24 GHVQ01035914.1:17-322(-)